MNKNIIELENTQLTEEYENTKTLNLFLESQEKRTPIVATVEACQPNPNATDPSIKYMAVCYVGGWKVLIPAKFMGFRDIDNNTEMTNYDKERAYRAYIMAMVGAEIEFIVIANENGISPALKMVIGNRKAALDKKLEANYFKSDKNGKSRMERAFEQEKSIQARVITVSKSVVWVEIFGLVTSVIAREVSWRYINRLQDVIHVGDNILLRFIELNIDKENKTIRAVASIKAAQHNFMRENMDKYQEGTIIRGIVTGAKDGYFVQVGDFQSGIDVYCKRVNCPDEPKIGDTVSVTLYIFDKEKCRVYGSIERILKRKESLTVA